LHAALVSGLIGSSRLAAAATHNQMSVANRLNATFAALAAFAAAMPAPVLANTAALSCTVERLDQRGVSLGKDPMTLSYDGGDETGVLTVESAWGQMVFPYAEYAAGEKAGDYKIIGNWPQQIFMPDLSALEGCLKSNASEYELQFLDVVSPLVEECRVQVPDSREPMPVNVELTLEVAGGVPDLYIVRTYDAESPVSGGHIDIVSLPQPQCKVAL
jgi:hypothetical protein